MNENNWTFLRSSWSLGTSEAMTISAASIKFISLHARAGYMAHIKRSLFPGSDGVLSSTPWKSKFQAKKKQSQQQTVKISYPASTDIQTSLCALTRKNEGGDWLFAKSYGSPDPNYSPLEECICVAQMLLTFRCSWLWITRAVQRIFKELPFCQPDRPSS